MRCLSLSILLTVGLGLSFPVAAVGQVAVVDTAAVLLRVAEDLHARGESDLADSILELILRRYRTVADSAGTRRLREAIGDRRAAAGRTSLIAWSTLYGAWLGAAIPLAFESDPSAEAFGAGLLIMSPLGFIASRQYTAKHSVTSTQAAAATFGSMWGTWQGVGWREVLDVGDKTRQSCFQQQCFEFEVESETAPFAFAIVGGVTGLVAGPLLAGKTDLAPGAMTTISHGSYWGSWFGLAAGVIANAENDGLLAWTLIGGNAGLLATVTMGPSWNLQTGQVWLITAGGMAGLVAGFGIDLLGGVDDEGASLIAPIIGSAVGLGLGWKLAQEKRDVQLEGELGTLIRLEHGHAGLGLPLPAPNIVPILTPEGRIIHKMGARFALFSAKF